ncbi:hypothetical protein ABZV78_23650 [Micromonospora sp. NPDC004540]|uniref:family 16 glycoside hydrolase n=1 Tax=Micromonospora sp. NPDC004540 TaxID=3154457 RepID=UPI0033BF6A59
MGKTASYVSLFDGTAESYANWGYVGGRGFALRDDGSMVTTNSPAGGGLGMLWYRAAQFGDFSLRLQFRDERGGEAEARSNRPGHQRPAVCAGLHRPAESRRRLDHRLPQHTGAAPRLIPVRCQLRGCGDPPGDPARWITTLP